VAALNYSFVDTTPVSFVFDQFAIRSATGYMIDNVTGDYTAVPEPSAYALMLGGIASLMVLKRSRKSL
jgi:hypothetical protein